MFKLGVVHPAGLRSPSTLLGRDRYASFLLLCDLAKQPDVDPSDYDKLVGFAPMPNGVWKQTRRGRMQLVDRAVLALLRDWLNRGTNVAVADLAASTGVTSVELYDLLRKEFDVRFVASDLYRDLIAVRSRRWSATVVFDPEGRPVQYIAGRLVLPAQLSESALYPINRAAKAILTRWFVPAARNALKRLDIQTLRDFEASRVDDFDVIRLPMLSKDTLEAVRADRGFGFEVWDILEPLPMTAHVVRAMNILTRDHFSNASRVRALRNCVDAVLPGGLFVVGWSPTLDPAAVEATIYRVVDGGLTELIQFNGGSEIDEIIASTFPIRRAKVFARVH